MKEQETIEPVEIRVMLRYSRGIGAMETTHTKITDIIEALREERRRMNRPEVASLATAGQRGVPS